MKKLWIGLALLSHCGILNASIDEESYRQLSFGDPYPRVVRTDLGVKGQKFFYGLDCLKVEILAVFDEVVCSSGEGLDIRNVRRRLLSLLRSYVEMLRPFTESPFVRSSLCGTHLRENMEKELWKEEKRADIMDVVYSIIREVLNREKGTPEFRMALLEAKEFFIENESYTDDVKKHPMLIELFGFRASKANEYRNGIKELQEERESLNSRFVPFDLDEDLPEDDLFADCDENGFF